MNSQPRPASALSLLAEIVASSNDAIFSRKLNGDISSWNPAAERIFGYTAKEVIGKSSSLLLPPDRSDETNKLLARIRSGQCVEHFETIRVRKDRTRLVVSLTISPIRNGSGQVVGASTIARDFTAQRDLERQLAEIGEQERQRLGRDLHDGLGQQLTGMELVCLSLARSLARRRLPDACAAKLLLSQIRSASDQARALAYGLTPILDAPDGLMRALEKFAANHKELLGIDCSFVCEEPVLIADHSTSLHLFRITQEAVTNALRHGRAEGVEILLRRKSGKLVLQVRDNGNGLRGQACKSTGMGLRTMEYRANALQGSLRVASVSPHGFRVVCEVPFGHQAEKPRDGAV